MPFCKSFLVLFFKKELLPFPWGFEPLLNIYIIRHGETEWSLSGRHTGRTDIALTAHGETEARALHAGLACVGFAHVFVSPRQRARDTCALAGLGEAARIEPDLAEWDYGDYEGMDAASIQATRPGWTAFGEGFPGGESAAQVSRRADDLIARLAVLAGNVALFTHGHFSSILAARWIGLPMNTGQHFWLGTARVGVLGFSPSHAELRVLALWNVTAAMVAAK